MLLFSRGSQNPFSFLIYLSLIVKNQLSTCSLYNLSAFYFLTHVEESSFLDLVVFLVGLGPISDMFWRFHRNQDPKINLK